MIYDECEDCKYWRVLGQGDLSLYACHYCSDSGKCRTKGEPKCPEYESGAHTGRTWRNKCRVGDKY